MNKPLTKMTKEELKREVELHRSVRRAVLKKDVFSLPELGDRVAHDPIEAQKYLEKQNLHLHFLPILKFLEYDNKIKIGTVPNFWFSDKTKYVVDVESNLFTTLRVGEAEKRSLKETVKVVVDQSRTKSNEKNKDVQLMSAYIDKPFVIRDTEDKLLFINDKYLYDYDSERKAYVELHLPLSKLLDHIPEELPLTQSPIKIRSTNTSMILDCEQIIDRAMRAQGAINARPSGILNNLLMLRKGIKFWKELWFIPIFHPDNRSLSVCLFFSNSNFEKYVIPVQDCLTMIIMCASASIEKKAIEIEKKKMGHHIDLFERLIDLVKEFTPKLNHRIQVKESVADNSTQKVKLSKTDSNKPKKIFISYARKDYESNNSYIDKLHNHLKPLIRGNRISLFIDTKLDIGEKWCNEIMMQIETSQIAILFISDEFISSKYITENELPLMGRLRYEKKLTIIPILLSPCKYQKVAFSAKKEKDYGNFGEIMAANDNKKTLKELNEVEIDRIFVKVLESIENLL